MVSTRRQAALGPSSTGSHPVGTQSQALQGPSTPTTGGGSSGVRKACAKRVTTDAASVASGTEIPGPSTAPAPLDSEVNSEDVAKPPTKRRRSRKWTPAMKQSALLVRETKKALIRNFMELPLDIVLEMFGHLHPRTLLAIGRTSKELRAMVFSKRLADVWRKSREGSGVPKPAEGISEPRWASLLFDTKRCQVCWKIKKSEVDWYFLRRACDDCLHHHTIHSPILGYGRLPRHPDYDLLKSVDIEMLEYVPWRRSWRSGGLTFWDDDVVDVAKAWWDLSGLTDLPARKAFQAWKMHRRETMRTNYSMIPTYHLWTIGCIYPSRQILRHNRQRSLEEDRRRRLEQIKARLREVGYRPEDIELSKLLDHNNHPRATLSDSDWIRVQRTIEPEVRQLRDFRVALEMELVTHERLLVLTRVYQDFLRTLPPSEQYYCPAVGSLRTEKEIVAILEAKNITVTQAHFQPIAAKMQTFIDQAQGRLKQDLTEAAARVGRRNFIIQVEEPWLLAKNVFGRCWYAIDGHPQMEKDRILVGWSMIATHSYKGHSKVWLRPGVPVPVPRAFELNAKASGDSQALITLAGLLNTVTVETMDECDPRFVCQRCMEATENLTVFTWRAALFHLHETEHGNWTSIRMATQLEIKAAKDWESASRGNVKAWSCNHCPRYLEASDADTKAAVIAHLADEHNLTGPQMPRDYFVNERCRHAYEVPYTISREASGLGGAIVA